MAKNIKKIKYGNLGFFRFGKVGGKILLTNELGDYIFLAPGEFNDFVQGDLDKAQEPYLSLKKKNFIRSELDLGGLISKMKKKRAYLYEGPSLHIVVVTMRCNHKCVYCHASAQDMAKKELDMDKATADKVIDMMLQTTSPFVAVEFQGGEPLVNWPIVKYIIDEGIKRNKKIGKDLQFRLVSNYSLMTEKIFKYLLANKVSLCVSLDGPEHIHNKNRPMQGSNKGSYYYAAKWAKKFFGLYDQLRQKGYIYRMGVAVTISRFSLPYAKEIVDNFLKLGFDDFYLRPLNPFGFTKDHFKQIGYQPDDYLKFYLSALDYMIDLNLKGTFVREKTATTYLIKILTDYDPNHLDYRSPCGAGLGQLAYHYNGDVYTCDEGRMLAMMGDHSFKLGNVKDNTYQEIVSSPVVRTMCTASCLEGLPGCSECVFKPYCGVCPIYNYFEQGNIFGQMPNNQRCLISKAIFDYLFKKLEDPKAKKVFEDWVSK